MAAAHDTEVRGVAAESAVVIADQYADAQGFCGRASGPSLLATSLHASVAMLGLMS